MPVSAAEIVPAPADGIRAGIRSICLSMLLSGIGPVLVRNSPVDFAATALWRLAIALPVAFFLARHSVLLPRRGLLWAAASGILLGLDLVLWNGAVVHTTILEATVLVMLYPLLVALGGYAFFRETVSRRLGLGGGIAFLGILLMTLGGASDIGAPGGRSSLVGDAMALTAAFFYAGSVLISARLCRQHDTIAVTFWVMLFAALGALPFALLEARPVPVTPAGWLYIAFYGAVTLASYNLFNRGLKTVPAFLATVIAYCQPVIATILAFLFMHETPSLLDVAASAVIIAGVVIATLQPKAATAAAAKPVTPAVGAE